MWLHLGREFLGGLPPFSFGELKGLSFVEELEGGWLGLHALMREALCARTAASEPVLHERLHRCLFAWWDERCQPADARSVEPAHELALEEAAFHRAAFERETFGDWAWERGTIFHNAARYALVQKLWELSLAAEEAMHPADDLKVGRTPNNLGLVLQDSGELDTASTYLERALAVFERALGSDHVKVARVLNNLGILLERQGKFDAALARLERALATWERVLGSEHPEVARTLNSLGLVFKDRGEFDKATVCLERALAINERALGPEHPDVSISLFNLSEVEERLGAIASAREHRVRALANFRSRLGDGHPHTQTVRRSLEARDAAVEASEAEPT